MAATNFTPIQLYFSTTASAVPTAANLAQGELAININDGKLYYEDSTGVVQVIATKGAGTIGGSTTQIQYNNAGALAGNAAMVFNNSTNVTTLTTLNLTNALGAIYGGTAQSTYAQGDIVYASAANTLAKLGIGVVNYILTSTGSIPQWVAPSSIAVLTATNLDGGAAGSVPYQSGVATTTFLAIGAANRVMTSTGTAPQWVTSLTGLTGVSSSSITNTSLTSGRVVVSSTAGLQADSANLTFSGTILTSTGFAGPLNGTVGATTATTGAFTTLSATGTITQTATAATNTQAMLLTGATTGAHYIQMTNTSASALIGVEGSAGGFLSTGGSPYALQLRNTTGRDVQIAPNATVMSTFSSTGLAVTGTLTGMTTLSGGTSGTGYSFSGIAPATSLTLDSSGNLLVGTTNTIIWNTANTGVVIGGGANPAIQISRSGDINLLLNRTTSDGSIQVFARQGTQVGSIDVTTLLTTYNTTSDYRLKNNQAPLTGSGVFIDALQPKTWNWAQDGSKGAGFVAHEFAEVSPSSVNGTKDAVDADGKPVYQAMQASSAEVIANLVAEIQSLRARVAQLESKA